MKFISHRGNLKGRDPDRENSPDYIDEAIVQGFDVEIDIWKIDDKYLLGHDEPQYAIDLNWLLDRSDNLWCHSKNLNALHELVHNAQLNTFWHQEDDYTLTTHNFIWSYPNKEIKEFSFRQIILLFNWTYDEIKIPHGGICSDEIILYKNKYHC